MSLAFRAKELLRISPGRSWWVGLVLAGSVSAVGMRSIYTVGATEAAVLTQFGRVAGTPVMQAGLHFKRPWQTVRVFDRRVRLLTFAPRERLTADHEPVVVMPYACWRVDMQGLERYLAATAGDRDVQGRLRELIWDALDAAIASHPLADWTAAAAATTTPGASSEPTLLNPVRQRCRQAAAQLGVDLVEVGLQRLTRPKRLAEVIQQAMQAETRRIEASVELAGLAQVAAIEADRGRGSPPSRCDPRRVSAGSGTIGTRGSPASREDSRGSLSTQSQAATNNRTASDSAEIDFQRTAQSRNNEQGNPRRYTNRPMSSYTRKYTLDVPPSCP